MMKILFRALTALAMFASVTIADTFIENYGSTTITNITVAQGEHTFEVDTPILFTKNTEWYLTYSGGSPVETDSSSTQNPSFTTTFSTPGTYWVRAVVHDSGWNPEETHRWEVTVGAPDLTSFIILPPGTYQPGDTISGVVNVSNVGDATSTAGYVDLFLNLGFPSYTSSDRIDHLYCPPIPAGTLGNPPFNYTIPISTPPGTYYLTSLADATDTSDESIEGNNTYEKTITILPAGPDLIVESIWTVPSTVIEGSNYVIKARIRNQGDATASATIGSQDVLFYLDASPVGSNTYDNVTAGGSVDVQTGTLVAPSAGSHPVRVVSDSSDKVDETRESNNDLTESIAISPPPSPDLIVEDITVNPGYAWRSSDVAVLVRNQGTASANFNASNQICYIEVNGQSKYVIADPSPISIPAGGSFSAEASFTVTNTGSHLVTAVVDPSYLVSESAEGNNSGSGTFVWTASTTHDTDGDGMIDADEVLAGSEPDNSNSVWQCSLVLTNGGFRLSWPSVSGRTYTVMRTTNLTNDFIAISPPLPAYPPGNWFESVNMPSNAFYRVKVEE